ncbi:MAG: DUF2933 domain-containing protein [Cyclobacteriaceae bacterium]
MKWLVENWLWIVFAIAFIAMHMFGHGGHGGHSGHGGQENNNSNEKQPQKGSDVDSAHHH